MKTIRQKTAAIAKINQLITDLEAKGMIKISSSTIRLYPELWYDQAKAKAFITNCYMFMRVAKKVNADQTLNFLNIETSAILAQYNPKNPSQPINLFLEFDS